MLTPQTEKIALFLDAVNDNQIFPSFPLREEFCSLTEFCTKTGRAASAWLFLAELLF